MSYVPKYIMKRLIPPDAVKLVEGGVEVTAINVLSPIPADQIPGSPLDIIEVKINTVAMTKEEKMKVTVTVDDKKFDFSNFKDAGTVAVGSKMVFFFPTNKFKKGDEITIELIVSIVNVDILFTRTIQ